MARSIRLEVAEQLPQAALYSVSDHGAPDTPGGHDAEASAMK
jgi:hypothetical protein